MVQKQNSGVKYYAKLCLFSITKGMNKEANQIRSYWIMPKKEIQS